MENTSKTLIIVVSIIIAILLLSVGIYIINQSNTTDTFQAEMSKMDIEIFNQQYLVYEGVQRGSKVKQLLMKAAIYNSDITGSSFSNKGGDFSALSEYGFGIRGSAQDILDNAVNLSSDWIQQLTFKGNYKVGVAQPANIRKIASWLQPSEKYRVSFSYADTGKIREIIIDDV